MDLRVLEYSGLDTSSPLDVTAGAAGSSASPNSGAATTTSANELIFGAGMTVNHYTGEEPGLLPGSLPRTGISRKTRWSAARAATVLLHLTLPPMPGSCRWPPSRQSHSSVALKKLCPSRDDSLEDLCRRGKIATGPKHAFFVGAMCSNLDPTPVTRSTLPKNIEHVDLTPGLVFNELRNDPQYSFQGPSRSGSLFSRSPNPRGRSDRHRR